MNLIQYRNFLKHLVFTEIKLKYRYSAFGFLWSLMNPVLMLTVYTFAFDFILKSGMKNYTLFLLAGMLPWNFFSMAVLGATNSVTTNAGLIRKQVFPLEVLPLSTVFVNLFLYLMALLVLLPASFLMLRVAPSLSLLVFPVLLLLQIAFTCGVSLLVSTATVYFRDVRHLMEVVIMLMFWITPIIYKMDSIPAPYNRVIFYLNPMASFSLGYQSIIFRQVMPAPEVLLMAVFYSLAALSSGLLVFNKYKRNFAEIA